MDEEILNAVHSMFGSSVKIVDCEKSSSVQQEESLMINGVPIKLDGMCNDDAAAIKTALLDGQMPSVDLLNQLLYQAGLLRQPIQLETTLSVKSSLVTTEEICVSQHGQILNERLCETKEDYLYHSNQKEILHPVLERGINAAAHAMVDNCKEFTRKEITERKDSKANPQKSATYAGISNSASKNSNTRNLGTPLSFNTSVEGYECSDNTDWSTNASCSNDITQVNSAASSRSFISGPSQPLHSASLNVISGKANKSSLSCDSGHDGVFHSISQSPAFATCNQTGNSFSSCYDIASSSDELDAILTQNQATSKFKMVSKTDQLQYRKPQTLISLPLQSYIDKNSVLNYCNGKLVSGLLDCLITHLVPTHDYSPEEDFKFAFLLSSRLYLKPWELLEKIHNIWAQQQEFTLRTSKSKIAGKLLKLIIYWMETFPYDFRDKNLMQEMNTLTRKCVDLDQALGKDIKIALQSLEDTLKEQTKHEEKLQSFSKPALRGSVDQLDKPSNSSTDVVSRYNLMRSESQPITRQLKRAGSCFATSNVKFNSSGVLNISSNHVDLAHQLTTIELKYFLSRIGTEELLRSFSLEIQQCMVGKVGNDDKHSHSPTNKVNHNLGKSSGNNATNLEAYISWFNRLSYLTATEIVKCEKRKLRVQTIQYWIETARECFNTGNFNSLMAILAGLNLNAVRRLKKTWAKVRSEKFSVLEHQMDPLLNFSSYRSTMKAAVWRSEGTNDDRQRIVIPFFTLFLKDLCKLNESCENGLPNGHVNFEKCWLISKQAQDFNKWKQAQCPYNELPNIIIFLMSSEIWSDKDLMLASFACESPDNCEEKEHYKLLRSATN